MTDTNWHMGSSSADAPRSLGTSSGGQLRRRRWPNRWAASAVALPSATRAAAAVALLLAVAPSRVAAAPASSPTIELYTMGQGEPLFERFGHTAICVVAAPARPGATELPGQASEGEPLHAGESRCYNYGTTNFAAAHTLGWQFLRGTARFWVSVASRERMLSYYTRSDRTVYRQKLPLTPEQARSLAAVLADGAREENRYYTYHHLNDNCSTRVRDVIDQQLGGVLSANSSSPFGATFRALGLSGLAEQTWVPPIAALVAGRRLDAEPTRYEAMFLPDVLRAEVATRLGAPPQLLYERRGRTFDHEPAWSGGWLVVIAIVVTGPLVASRLTGRFERRARAWAAAVLFVLGAAVWLVAAITTIDELRYNETLLVFLPTDLVLWLGSQRLIHRYAQARAVELLIVSLLAAANILIQPIAASILIAAGPMLVLAFGQWAPSRQLGAQNQAP